MKNLVAVALLSIATATPVYAADAPPKAVKHKPASAKSVQKDDECDSKHHPAARSHDMEHHMGYGMEHGMEHGMGHGMMGGGDMGMMLQPNMRLLMALDLSDEQQSKINKLADELKHNNWGLQGSINDESAKLRDLYEADRRDPASIGKVYQKLFDLKRQMIENYMEVQNRIEDVLTPEQRTVMKEERRKMRTMYQPPMH